ncbi:MAG: L-2-amino-thiazoline-4-carboxylic acid hydrolase [Alphaproteobacteria bacterium]|nr:L-2-amino-thiazoline-4-carboxylic acid hydrolase [Alphaproteobacteria bacterium]
MKQMPYLERAKIQAEILLPLFRLLKVEIGEERAGALLRAAVDEFATALGAEIGAQGEGTSLEKMQSAFRMFMADEALVLEPVAHTANELSVNIRGCKYAEYFQDLGEAAFGAMLVCGIDPPMTAAVGPDLSLERTRTIMAGDSHCDFCFKQV